MRQTHLLIHIVKEINGDVRENEWDGVRVYRRREAGIGDPELIFGG